MINIERLCSALIYEYLKPTISREIVKVLDSESYNFTALRELFK